MSNPSFSAINALTSSRITTGQGGWAYLNAGGVRVAFRSNKYRADKLFNAATNARPSTHLGRAISECLAILLDAKRAEIAAACNTPQASALARGARL